MTNQERTIYLIQKSYAGQLSNAERAEMDEWLLIEANRAFYVSQLEALMLNDPEQVAYDAAYWQPVLNKVLAADKVTAVVPIAKPTSLLRRNWWIAAAVLLLLATGVFYLVVPEGKRNLAYNKNVKDIAPGHSGALLTLADGTIIELDSLRNGVIGNQNGASLLMADGKLAYQPGTVQNAAMIYNTITTPLGRQFQLSLPDGTMVWLNAGSSLRYPTAFSGKERSVEVTGEAYFEVAGKADQPFKVITVAYGTIEVLGTAFNVNAYADEVHAATTLVSGAVRVNIGMKSLVLAPGQQAQVNGVKDMTLNQAPDIAQVTAWKNGVFNFQNQRVDQVMRQLSRWYNLEVVYEKGIPDLEFFGEMGKNLSLQQVLHVLEGSGVKVRIESGNKLVVMP